MCVRVCAGVFDVEARRDGLLLQEQGWAVYSSVPPAPINASQDDIARKARNYKWLCRGLLIATAVLVLGVLIFLGVYRQSGFHSEPGTVVTPTTSTSAMDSPVTSTASGFNNIAPDPTSNDGGSNEPAGSFRRR